MHSFSLGTLLLLSSILQTPTTADVPSQNTALTNQAVTLDASVVAITPQTPPATASQMPTSLQDLTNAISADLNAPQSQSLAIDLNPTPGEADVVLSYGLFANTIEELMIDFVDQSVTLITVFNLKSAIYNQLLAFNTAFQSYATHISGVVGDANDQLIVSYNTMNATYGITNATQHYQP